MISKKILKKYFLIFFLLENKKKDKYLNLVRTTESFVNNVLISSFCIAFEIIVILSITIYLLFWNLQTTIYLFGILSIFVFLFTCSKEKNEIIGRTQLMKMKIFLNL